MSMSWRSSSVIERSAAAGASAAECAEATRGEWVAAGAGSMHGYWLRAVDRVVVSSSFLRT